MCIFLYQGLISGFNLAAREFMTRFWIFITKFVVTTSVFTSKVKRIKSMKLSMDQWHLDNMEVIITLWTMNNWLCSFSLHWYFLYCSQWSQVILKNLILEFPKKKHDQTTIDLTDNFEFICRLIFELSLVWWN